MRNEITNEENQKIVTVDSWAVVLLNTEKFCCK